MNDIVLRLLNSRLIHAKINAFTSKDKGICNARMNWSEQFQSN